MGYRYKINENNLLLDGYIIFYKNIIIKNQKKYKQIFVKNEKKYSIDLEGEIDTNKIFFKEYIGKEKKWIEYRNNLNWNIREWNESDNNIKNLGYVYLIKSKYGYKVGKTKNLFKRNKIFEVKLPFNFEIKNFIITSNYNEVETEIHHKLKLFHLNGEWFKKDIFIENYFTSVKTYLNKSF